MVSCHSLAEVCHFRALPSDELPKVTRVVVVAKSLLGIERRARPF